MTPKPQPPDPPLLNTLNAQGSYDDLDYALVGDPSALAEDLNLGYHEVTLPTMNIAQGAQCTVEIRNVVPDNALMVIDLDLPDQDLEYQTLTATATYRNVGGYSLRAFVIHRSAVNAFYIPVNVGSGSTLCRATLDVVPEGPEVQYQQGAPAAPLALISGY